MLAATHILVGAMVFHKTRVPIMGISLSFASHFIMDAIPHYDLNVPWNAVIGTPIILLLAILSYRRKDLLLLVAGFLGALPDALVIINFNTSLNHFHSWMHFDTSLGVSPYLFVPEFIFLVLLSIFLTRTHGKKIIFHI